MDEAFIEGAKRGAFSSRWQRPLQMVPGLTARPLWDVNQLPSAVADAVVALRREWRAIRAEALGLLRAGSCFRWKSPCFTAEPERLVDAANKGTSRLFKQTPRQVRKCTASERQPRSRA